MALNEGLLQAAPSLAFKQAPQVDFAAQQEKMYTLADAEHTYDGQQDESKDKATVQEYLKQGGNLGTEAGIAQATEALKGKVSPKAYNNLVKMHGDWQKNQADIANKLAEADENKVKAFAQKTQQGLGMLEPLVMQYDSDVETLTPQMGEVAARAKAEENFNSKKAALGQYMGQNNFPKPMIDELTTMNPKVAKARYEQATEFQKRLKEAQEIRTGAARAKMYENIAGKPQGTAGELEALHDSLANGDISQAEYEAGVAKVKGAGGRGSALGTQSVVPQEHANLHGEEYLKTLPPGVAGNVKAIAEGRETFASLGIRGPDRQAITQYVNQYDPKYEMARAPVRAAVWKDFTSGTTAKNITAINTAIGHIGTLDELGDALQNNDTKLLNRVFNKIAVEIPGSPDINNFDIAKGAVGNELMRVFRQVGASEQETKDWEAKFTAAATPEMLKGAVKTAVKLLQSRINALDSQWKRGMGTDQSFPNILSPEAEAIYSKFVSKPAAKSQGAAPQATAAVNPAAGGFPKVTPQEQADRDNDAKAIKQRELATEQAALAASKTEEERAQHQRNIDELNRELSPRQARKAAAVAPPGQSGPVKIASDAEWEKLAPGTKFTGPDGKVRVKQ